MIDRPPHIAPCGPEGAPPRSRVVYEEFHRGMGFPAPPNFILTQGSSPTNGFNKIIATLDPRTAQFGLRFDF